MKRYAFAGEELAAKLNTEELKARLAAAVGEAVGFCMRFDPDTGQATMVEVHAPDNMTRAAVAAIVRQECAETEAEMAARVRAASKRAAIKERLTDLLQNDAAFRLALKQFLA
jgi:hypothetical protein